MMGGNEVACALSIRGWIHRQAGLVVARRQAEETDRTARVE
jgi:hypothetical protein